MHTLIRLIADGTLVPIVLIGVYALIAKVPSRGRYAAYCRILMAGLTAFLMAKFMSTLFDPSGERPFEALGTAAGAAYLPNSGFPSDHALFSAAITYAVWFETKNKILTYILIALTILVCVGRVLALVHTPIDIIGGIIAASIGAIWYLTALPSLSRSKKKLKSQVS